jgi:hypothetical protein
MERERLRRKRQRHIESGQNAERHRARHRQKRGEMFGVHACGICGTVGHNRRTCSKAEQGGS